MEYINNSLLKAEKYVRKVILAIVCFLMVETTLLIFMQVIFRYLLNNSLSWAEELCRYSTVWLVFLGTGYVLGMGAHTNMDLLVSRLPEKIGAVLEKFNAVLLVFFGFMLIRYGYVFFKLGMRQRSSAMTIPMHYIYVAIPIGGCLILFYALLVLLRKKGTTL